MKNSALLAIITVMAISLSACNKYEKVAGDPMDSKICTLDNGLKIYMTVNKEEPRIQTYIAVRSGGKNDPRETTGLAHYFEHLMFKGSELSGTQDYAAEKPMLDEIERMFEQYRTITDPEERLAFYRKIDSVSYEASKIAIPNEYDKLMSMIGSRGSNAWTSQDETVFTEDIPSNQIDNWAKIEADRFRHNVIRGFHTELEAVYEEKNMSLTSDTEKLFEALQAGLFQKHPYGLQTVLGTQEQLKNPSITNIKEYYKTYYVPNNIAICVSGDFNPDEMVATIKKYFGDWKPNPSIPELTYEPEDPITTPIVKEVFGQEAEMAAIGWRLPGARDLATTAVADIASSILSNGRAGLIDIDINQQQKALMMEAGNSTQPDYSMFLAMGMPKQGQSLEEIRDLAFTEIARLAAGDFDDSLIESTVNNIKLGKMRQLESNRVRANLFVDAFISGIPWKDACRDIERYEAVKKEDIVAFAKEYLSPESCVIVYKRQGEDTSIQKMVAPAITPIETNRDKSSTFLTEIQNSPVKPIEPVFVDFSKDMSEFGLVQGVNVLYKKNELNDIASVEFVFNRGLCEDPALDVAVDYIQYLGIPGMSAAEIGARFYALACSFNAGVDDHTTTFSVSGLSENVPEAVKLMESLIFSAIADDAVLEGLKADLLKNRSDAKNSQDACFSELLNYLIQGPEYIKQSTLTDAALKGLEAEGLLGKIRDLYGKGHEILYFGPQSAEEAKTMLADCHKTGSNPEVLPENYSAARLTPEKEVLLVPYKANNFYYMQFSNRGEKFDRTSTPSMNLFNEYFGGGMNSLVFQEMRESRGLAYSANARISAPAYPDGNYSFNAFIASQNDKLQKAVETFDMIINDMPEAEQNFVIAKEGILSRMRTQRTRGMSVLYSYRNCRRMGLSEPQDKEVFEKIQSLTLADVKSYQEKWIKDRPYIYGILGDPADLNISFLKTLGPVKLVSTEEIFGY